MLSKSVYFISLQLSAGSFSSLMRPKRSSYPICGARTCVLHGVIVGNRIARIRTAEDRDVDRVVRLRADT